MADNTVEVDVQLAIQKALAQLDELNKKFDGFSENSHKAIAAVDGAWEVFAGTMEAMGVTKILELTKKAAEELFRVFIVDGIAAASKQEDSINSLNQSLVSSGQFTTEASQAMQDYADNLQATTKYSNDATLNNMALIESITHLRGEGLEKATTAAANLAATMGIDFTTASEKVARAAEGNITAFQKMGIHIEKGATNAETFANTLAKLNGFQGAAEAQTLTYSGAVAQLHNSFEDMQKQTGSLITQNDAITLGIKLVSEQFLAGADAVEENKDTLKEFIQEGIFYTIDALSILATTLDGTYRFFKAIWDGIVTIVDTASTIVLGLFLGLVKGAELLINAYSPVKVSFKDTTDTLISMTANMAKEVGKDLGKVGDDFTKKSFLGTIADQIDAFNVRYKQGVADLSQAEDDRTENQEENSRKRLADLQAELAAKQSYEIAAQFQIKAWEELNASEKLAREKEVLTTIASLTKSNYLALFRIGQAAAIANATIDGISAVQKALATPVPLNFVLAATVGAAAAVNVANIATQAAPGFAKGGVVDGNQYSGDSKNINVNSREMVITVEQQADLFNFIKNGGNGKRGGGGNVFNNYVSVIDDSQIQGLMSKIKNQLEFANGTISPVIP